jgi:ferredoxin-NADP reductase
VPFSSASASAVLAFAALGGFLFMNTLYLQEVRHLSALEAGLYTLPLAAMTLIFSPVSGRIVGRRGPRTGLLAGGIGIAPFLGWLTTERVDQPDRVDLFYSTTTQADSVFLPDLLTAAQRLPNLTLHPVFTREGGRLTVDRIVALAGALDADTHVFLCGPAAMVDSLGRELRRRGIPRHYIHAEHFAFR